LTELPQPETDDAARRTAVDPHRSVIVQAPAGSGKTTLLVERLLRLLQVVEKPEQILAITFTRKAASEMRHRVLRLLAADFDSDAPHEQAALTVARELAPRVKAWQLLDNPQRLMIRTIDSFNHFLARAMPVATALGPVPEPVEHSQAFYRLAARRLLDRAGTDHPRAADIDRLLAWRHHHRQQVEDLLTELLGQRDQWLRALSLTGDPDRQQLEATLAEEAALRLGEADAALTAALAHGGCSRAELLELLTDAGRRLRDAGEASGIVRFAEAERLPDPVVDDLPLWEGLAEALLTGDRQSAFRKRVDKRNGFPPESPAKAPFTSLLQRLAERPQLAAPLRVAARLPVPRYRDGDWRTLAALIRVLQAAAVELQLVFARSGATDYAGLAAAALQGLGDEERGFTDLGLYLDHRIHHVLVDEFQDTNWGQLRLLEKLLHGWTPGDGRSLFLVGDPMQSIYRFREAEVGLFVRCRQQGVGDLALEDLRLSRNFRSRREIVEWVNGHLGPVFPAREQLASGAVRYSPSSPARDGGGRVQTLASEDNASEAVRLVDLLVRRLEEHAGDTDYRAAIIVRSRGQLRSLLPALRARGVAYRAVKLDALAARPVVQDLLAITRVLRQPEDRAALLTLLRSPVCGLTLEDLQALAGDGREPTAPEALERLDDDAASRAAPVFEALAAAQQSWQRLSLSELVRGVWQRLGGPSTVPRPATDLRDAEAYLTVLSEAEGSGLLDDWHDFLALLDRQRTEGDPPDADIRLEILTIHSAKGLEWDLVILPGLNQRGRNDEGRLLHWLPLTGRAGDEQVLLAPLRRASESTDPELVQLIRDEQRVRDDFERQRLLYVATTRARRELVLSAVLDPGKETPTPAAGSLLADLWPTCAEDFLADRARSPAAAGSPADAAVDQRLRRIRRDWRPEQPAALAWQPPWPNRLPQTGIEFNWAGTEARRTGTVLHRLLQRVGEIGIEALSTAERQRLRGRSRDLLRALGSQGAALEQSTRIIEAAFDASLDSATGRWILSGNHAGAACEQAISGVLDGELVNAIVDRTFVDGEGVRWIIDYKSGYHDGADLPGFLQQEAERYREQMDRYRRLYEALEQAPVRTALFLPRHAVLQAVDPLDGGL